MADSRLWVVRIACQLYSWRRAFALSQRKILLVGGVKHGAARVLDPRNIASLQDTTVGTRAAQGEYERAEVLYLSVLRFRQETLGATNLLTAISLMNLAKVYIKQGKHAEGVALHKRSVAIREQLS